MQAMKTLLTSLLVAAFVAAGACAAEGVGAERRLPVVAIPDYCQSNGVVSVKRSMTEAILKAGCLPVLLPEMEDPAVDQFLSQCDAVMVGGGIKGQDYPRRCAYEGRVIALAAKRGLPIVGICHGCQVINLHFGGTLAPVPSDRKLVHKDATRFERTGERAEHRVSVSPGGTLMAGVFGEGAVKLNSSHTMRCLNPVGQAQFVTHHAVPGAGARLPRDGTGRGRGDRGDRARNAADIRLPVPPRDLLEEGCPLPGVAPPRAEREKKVVSPPRWRLSIREGRSLLRPPRFPCFRLLGKGDYGTIGAFIGDSLSLNHRL